MRMFGFLGLLLTPTAAFADIGHLGELAGHDHLMGLAALGLAGLAAALGLRGPKKDEADEAEISDVEPENS